MSLELRRFSSKSVRKVVIVTFRLVYLQHPHCILAVALGENAKSRGSSLLVGGYQDYLHSWRVAMKTLHRLKTLLGLEFARPLPQARQYLEVRTEEEAEHLVRQAVAQQHSLPFRKPYGIAKEGYKAKSRERVIHLALLKEFTRKFNEICKRWYEFTLEVTIDLVNSWPECSRPQASAPILNGPVQIAAG